MVIKKHHVDYHKTSTQLRTKLLVYDLQAVCLPNVCTYGQNCKHALRHLHTVSVPFAASWNLSVFCANTKGIPCVVYTDFFMFVNHMLVACIFCIFSIRIGQCLLSVRWNYGSSCVHVTFAENWIIAHVARTVQRDQGTHMCTGL